MLQYMLRTCGFLGFAAMATSFLGALHPAGDSLAVFRLPIAILAALALIRCDRRRALRWPLAALVLAMLGGHVAWWMPDAGLAPARGGGPRGTSCITSRTSGEGARGDRLRRPRARRGPGCRHLQEASRLNRPVRDTLGARCPALPRLGPQRTARADQVIGTTVGHTHGIGHFTPESVRDQEEWRHLAAFCARYGAEAVPCNPRIGGHVTGSACLLSPGGDAKLLTHHRKRDRSLQPDGHCHGLVDARATALREAEEESALSGLRQLREDVFDIVIHEIPATPRDPVRPHYDVRYLAQAASHTVPVSGQSHAPIRGPLPALERYTTAPGVLRLRDRLACPSLAITPRSPQATPFPYG